MFSQNSQHYYYLAVQLTIFVVCKNLIFERLDLNLWSLKIFEIQFQFRISFVLKEFVLNRKRTRIEIPYGLAFYRFITL